MTRTVCSHGDRVAAPCGDDRWCMEESGHEGPHTGQAVRCACGLSYQAARERFIETGEPAALERMLLKVTLQVMRTGERA